MCLPIALVMLVIIPSQARTSTSPSPQNAQKGASGMNSAATLEHLLASADWDAVDVAQRQGPLALPAIRIYVHSSNYRSRQIALASVARIGGAEAGTILASGLTDGNVNVELQAAKELSTGRFPSAAESILQQLEHGKDDLVRQFLALAAGYIPGRKTVSVLQPLAGQKDELAMNA